jgi:ribosomal protein S18 acetylase RimI-like enzyme
VDVTIDEVVDSDDSVIVDLVRLIAQLSSQPSESVEELTRESISSPHARVLVARVGGVIVGTLTLVLFTIPSGRRAWIEDVVVDKDSRRTGVGEELVNAAVALARESGARTVDLTSRASRTEAHRLYEKVGFQTRDTNVYRIALGG